MQRIKIVVEKHKDWYIDHPLDFKGIAICQGETYETALADVKSAVKFHVKTFGQAVLEVETPVLEAFVGETEVNA